MGLENLNVSNDPNDIDEDTLSETSEITVANFGTQMLNLSKAITKFKEAFLMETDLSPEFISEINELLDALEIIKDISSNDIANTYTSLDLNDTSDGLSQLTTNLVNNPNFMNAINTNPNSKKLFTGIQTMFNTLLEKISDNPNVINHANDVINHANDVINDDDNEDVNFA